MDNKPTDKWEWVSVGNKPEANINILLTNNRDGWVVIGYRDNKGYWNQWESDKDGDCEIYPTHWMPLPSPPNK